MRRADIAAWLLEAVTTPERAASTAGDLVECATERGSLWFWWSLWRTVNSRMWQGFAASPRTLSRLVFQVWIRGLVYSLGYLVLRALADGVSIAIQGHALAGNASWLTGTVATSRFNS